MALSYTNALMRLSRRTRNRIRAALQLDANGLLDRINQIRRDTPANELAQLDRVLWAHPRRSASEIPLLFPTEPQTTDEYYRLDAIPLNTQLGVLNAHVKSSWQQVYLLMVALGDLNRCIVGSDYQAAAACLGSISANFGYSHCVLRKAALLNALEPNSDPENPTNQFLATSGLDRNNLIVSSVVHCYQEGPDFLSMKRSIMGLPDRGKRNRYSRDIARIPFHPLARDKEELAEFIQSGLQSSLIDALLTAKCNSHLFCPSEFESIRLAFVEIEEAAPSMEDIARMYPATNSQSEMLFYKRTSAWLESMAVVQFRTLVDHFFDAPNAHYLEITENLIEYAAELAGDLELELLSDFKGLASLGSKHLCELQAVGSVTRSALFNLCLHKTQGYTTISERTLVDLMGKTQDLAKTISVPYATNLAKGSGSEIAKLVLYLLIAKKSRNERDDYLLRKLVQEIAKKRFAGNLVELLDFLNEKSSHIARYAYEVFSEEFIGKLYGIVQSTTAITEKRAELHSWMARQTGDKAYHDRARTLLIDHQLNRVRNEIDDNRLFVDVSRFLEWVNEEIVRDLDVALTAIEHKASSGESHVNDSILYSLIGRCYDTFCSHRAFGIASYLGRRIRHGTFKGHLMAAIVEIEHKSQFAVLFQDSRVNAFWSEWKVRYQRAIDEIIRERLHVASTNKTRGFLNTALDSAPKLEIVSDCARSIERVFRETNSSENVALVITEYCWRLAEVDLKLFAGYLKGQGKELIGGSGLAAIQEVAPDGLRQLTKDLFSAVRRSVITKLMTMQTWFKRPPSVSPKTSLSLLFRAVVEEIRASCPDLPGVPDVEPNADVELFGGAYHSLYDCFYIVVDNAAKHGRTGGPVGATFAVTRDEQTGRRSVIIAITSEIRDHDDEEHVRRKLCIGADRDVENAQTYESQSGIPKLYQLAAANPAFQIDRIDCVERRVVVTIRYLLGY